ncbi:homocysteine S-methyltransferase family protein [bacterium]|nr:homocysteine S-methyltransferase family protein [bacterium]
MDFRKRLMEEEVIVCDGAMGTLLYSLGVPLGGPVEEVNLSNPKLVEDIHRQYISAGAEVIETNTFGANRLKLGKHGLKDKVGEINMKGVEIARRASEGKVMVAGSIGPLDKLLEPFGELKMGEAREIFREQASYLIEGGVDLIILETFHSLLELKTAVLAVKEVDSSLPIIAQMSFSQEGRTSMGVTPSSLAVVMEGLGVDVVGANCGSGPEGILEALDEMSKSTSLPLSALPNAGFPSYYEGRTIFPSSPRYFERFADEALKKGAKLIGGCCGTTPEHIKALSKVAKGKRVQRKIYSFPPRVASKGKIVSVGEGAPVIIGERINTFNRPALQEDISSGRMQILREEARKQVESGAKILDVNIELPHTSPELMRNVLLRVSEVVDVPVAIDTLNEELMEEGLATAEGKPILNSFTADEASARRMLPLAKKYGALAIGLTMRERRVPLKAEDRLALARELWEEAKRYNLENSLLIDPAVLSCATSQEHILEILNSIKLIREKIGVPVVIGLSNVSYGLPRRALLNASFLAMAMSYGLSAVIMDPLSEEVRNAYLASCALLGYDGFCLNYISAFRSKK